MSEKSTLMSVKSTLKLILPTLKLILPTLKFILSTLKLTLPTLKLILPTLKLAKRKEKNHKVAPGSFRILAILFCILKNNASGYPATVTAVDIIDTMYVFIDLFISVRCF